MPGDGGSRIDAKLNKSTAPHVFCSKKTKDFFNVWLNMELLAPLVIDCWTDNVRLNYDNVTRKTTNQEGVEIRIPGWGNPDSVEYLDPGDKFFSVSYYFKYIGDALAQRLGYVRNLSIRGAPYDFRKGPNENTQFFVDLKELVEESYGANENTPVTLLCHSMGCPMSLKLLQMQSQAWKDKYISKFITLAGAWGGSAKSVKVYAIGDDLGALALRASVMREQQITMPSLAWLLPSPEFWKADEVLVRTTQRDYTFADLQDFFTDLNYTIGWEMRKDMLPYLDFSPPNVEVHCIYGSQVPTVEVLNYPTPDLDGSPKLMTGDGDGTVNLRSLEGCARWRAMQKNPVSTFEVPQAEHMKMLDNEQVIQYILDVLSN